MTAAALLELCAELLRSVLRFDHPTDAVVSAFFRLHRSLGQRERHALAETVYAVLRRRALFQHLARGGPGTLERRLALLGWPGGDTPWQSALAPQETVWLSQARRVESGELPRKLRHNLPDWLAAELEAKFADAEFWALVASLDAPAALDLRVNALRGKRADAQAMLAAAGVQASPTPYSPWGLRVQGKPALHKLDVFTQGRVEVQDEGSQLLALLTEARRGETVVDFCAGGGGKTLALGAMMRNTGRLYAFDTSGHRLDALEPRLLRSGLSTVYRTQIAHEQDERVLRLAGKVDRVLVDAPCSGLGTLRRNPDLKWRQSPESVLELRLQQTAILASAARLLKPGGRLVYATCSLLASESESVAAAFDAEHHRDFNPIAALEVLKRSKLVRGDTLVEGPYLRLWPHRHATDGFFAAVWEKR